jgi:hypothetical protein
MRLWFGGLAALLGFPGKDEASIQSILRLAVARSAPIGIGTVDGVALPSPLAGHVIELEAEALVISRPFEGSSRRELVTGEHLHLSIGSERGFHHGDVEVLGRFVSGEGYERRYGYRVSIPKALVHEERRGLHRVPVAFDLAPRSVLLRPVTLEGGLCVRASLQTLLRPGEQVVVRAEFPAVLPSIHTRATVAHVVEARKPGEHEIGLRFNDAQPALGQAIRSLEIRRINRAGAA